MAAVWWIRAQARQAGNFCACRASVHCSRSNCADVEWYVQREKEMYAESERDSERDVLERGGERARYLQRERV
jgi:hypothetical protein